MTEADWQSSTDPASMLAYLRERGLASERKLLCAVQALPTCHDVAHVNDPLHWLFGWVSEYVDEDGNQNCDAECKAEVAAIIREIWGNPWKPVTLPVESVKCRTCDGIGRLHNFDPYKMEAEEYQCYYCRGTGIRQKKSWLTPGIIAHARHIYEARDWELMPCLADMLEEANCSCQAILDHCRQKDDPATWPVCPVCDGDGRAGFHGHKIGNYFAVECPGCNSTGRIKPVQHTRGCFVIDCILGHN